ncbi:hypothetical protein CI610_01165 [invertebrate metagenome]|uniref:Uncharacterized protein n=1 Tax=invertebrate metagenome TaxID=1711999 RepID=A0A2H9T9F1_9ZZZZ
MKKIITWLFCLYIALIFVQSLPFKFTGADETAHIFSVLADWSGLNWFAAYGAYGVGVMELLASVLLFTAWRFYGALLATGLMGGAVFFHLFTPLGIKMPAYDASGNVIGDDGGLLFYNACGVFASAIIVVLMEFLERLNRRERFLFS